MPTLSTLLRRQLESTVREAREVADEAATDAVARLAIAAADAPPYLSAEQKALRRRLRAHARSLGDQRDRATGAMTTARLAEATAYEHWHRMLFGRFLVERNLLIHPSLSVPLSRDELKELAQEEGLTDEWALVERFAAPSLPAVFKPDDRVLQLTLDPHFQLRLRALVTNLPEEIFAADDSLGWTYQFWRAAEKKDVNERQVKIGTDELPAVTQLFTEPYMVKFLLHNTLGAWWANKVLTANHDLARNAPDEDALRGACALPGVEWEYLRFIRAPLPNPPLQAGEGTEIDPPQQAEEGTVGATALDESDKHAGHDEGTGPWRPAAGTFSRWPHHAAEITYLDPCCGSGHFLVEAFNILAALRQAEEGLSPQEAACAVLRDNLHGLEIDGRCVQIAAFNVALATWRLAGGPVTLPVPHIAWVGAPPPLPKSEFLALANGDAELQHGLAALHDLFRQAPLLGSLIELIGGDLIDPTRIARLDQSVAALVEKMRGAEPELAEGALAARGMADGAAILGRRFTLQATNPPFLGRGRQASALADHLKARFDAAKADLATAMVTRMRGLATPGGTVASVTPQNWLYLGGYKRMRDILLKQACLSFVGALGPRCFETISGEVVNAALVALTETRPNANTLFAGLDANVATDPAGKAAILRSGDAQVSGQKAQLGNPDARIGTVSDKSSVPLLNLSAECYQGVVTGDIERFITCYWETVNSQGDWQPFRTAANDDANFQGVQHCIRWEHSNGSLHAYARASRDKLHDMHESGNRAWGRMGVAVNRMRGLEANIYYGEIFDNNVAVILPKDSRDLAAMYCFCLDAGFQSTIRSIDRTLKVTNATLLKARFDYPRWSKIGVERYPKGIPDPYSDDPTQWVFHGHPRYAEAGTELHVALARLAGYRWPQEGNPEMRLSADARARVAKAAMLPEADPNGLLPLVPVLGERSLADRLRAYCAAAWGDAWQQESEATLIASACERAKEKLPKQLTFDAWLPGVAARQHAKLFHDRPFLWWITDGRPDGFTVVAHYHRLDHANLERLAYTVLGDWIARLGDDPRAEAAHILQQKLALILEGEAPYDIFVRWKSLEHQPLGWDPDLDDGVRLNIRPFVEAKVLAYVPNVKYSPPDRGTDVQSAPWYDVFGGKRRNDYHTTLGEKRAARAQAAAE